MSKYFFMWFSLLAAAFANAAVRELTYAGAMETAVAHRISVFTGIALTGLVIWPMLSRWRPASPRESLLGGLLWLLMTEAFEFCMVVLYQGNALKVFLWQHDVAAGELWPLFLLWIAAAPVLFHGIRGRSLEGLPGADTLNEEDNNP
ncbi:MAG: hypothetical protein JXA20_11755 [Spirochaetes bacterium]|nr:hypothetical protein [Spirochaetota bacterium]